MTTSFVFGSRIFSGRTTETTRSMRRSLAACARNSLPRKPVAPGQEDVQPRASAARAQEGAGVLLELLDARLDLLLGEMRGLAELEEDVPVRHADEALRAPFHGLAARGRADRLGELDPEEVHLPQAVLDGVLVAGPLDQAAREVLGRDVDRILVAMGMDEQVVRVDRPEDLLAGREAHLRDVAGRRALPQHFALGVDRRRDLARRSSLRTRARAGLLLSRASAPPKRGRPL